MGITLLPKIWFLLHHLVKVINISKLKHLQEKNCLKSTKKTAEQLRMIFLHVPGYFEKKLQIQKSPQQSTFSQSN